MKIFSNIFKKLFKRKRKSSAARSGPPKAYVKKLEKSLAKLNTSIKYRASGLSDLNFNWKWLYWGVTVLAIYLASSLVIQVISLMIRPDYNPIGKKGKGPAIRREAPVNYQKFWKEFLFQVIDS